MAGSRDPLRLAAAVVFTLVAWASAFVVIRGLGTRLDGAPLALGRLAAGTAALGILLLLSRRWVRPVPREWVLLAVFGVGWFGCYNVALNLAEQVLDAGTTALIVGIGPILIAFGSAAILHERIGRWLGIGVGTAFLGVALIAIADGASLGGGVGVLGAVVAAVTYAIGVLAQKPLLGRLPGVQVTFLGCAIGFLVCLPFAGALVSQLASASASTVPATLLGVVYLGVVPTALAFTTWAYALTRMTPSALSITTYVVPVLVVGIAFLAFGEVPAPLALVGGASSLLGVGLSRRRARVARTAPPVTETAVDLPHSDG
ncbi:MAG: EamA family transporter [Micrococcales bacterium]|nr:EamA family transporter [Micrococcales bacterium]